MSVALKLPPEDAVDSPRRVEPLLVTLVDGQARLEARIGRLEIRMDRLEERQTKLEDSQQKLLIEFAEMRGRMTGVEAQVRMLPTAWTTAGMVVGLFSAVVLLLSLARL